LALKAALCRLRLAFIVCFLCSSRPKVHLNWWSSFRGPPQGLPFYKVGKSVFVNYAELESFIRQKNELKNKPPRNL
jgi:hypothetical protein